MPPAQSVRRSAPARERQPSTRPLDVKSSLPSPAPSASRRANDSRPAAASRESQGQAIRRAAAARRQRQARSGNAADRSCMPQATSGASAIDGEHRPSIRHTAAAPEAAARVLQWTRRRRGSVDGRSMPGQSCSLVADGERWSRRGRARTPLWESGVERRPGSTPTRVGALAGASQRASPEQEPGETDVVPHTPVDFSVHQEPGPQGLAMDGAAGSAATPLRIAVFGAGPAGFFAAEELLKVAGRAVAVDLFDRPAEAYGWSAAQSRRTTRTRKRS